jgi:hypothetical protein
MKPVLAASLTFTALCFWPVVALSADAPTYRWQTGKDSLSLMAGDKVVYTYQFAAGGGYPYIHPLGLPGGPVMSALAPADHPWHRGLWFSWKFLNGVNYWEFPPTASSFIPDRATRRSWRKSIRSLRSERRRPENPRVENRSSPMKSCVYLTMLYPPP